MIQIRKNVFETNSSSTHSLVMAVKSEFDKWELDEYYYCKSWWKYSEEHAPEAFKGKFKQGSFFPVAEVDAYYEGFRVKIETLMISKLMMNSVMMNI